MRLHRFRPRFTVRRMMMLVALVALVLGAGRWLIGMRRLSAAYRERAYQLGAEPGFAATCNFDVMTEDGEWVNVRKDENYWIGGEWRHNLAEKYRRVADRPWLPVEPDPPPPVGVAHPRPPERCPKELRMRGRPCAWYVDSVHPWWTFPWAWRNEPHWYPFQPRWSFP